MIYYEVVHQVVVFASNFHKILYYWNVFIVCLELEAWRLVLGSRRLGACSFWPSILIRGPCLAHPLDMILSSRAIVASCGPDAWLTSIVNFFIYPLLLALAPEVSSRDRCMVWQIYRSENHQTRSDFILSYLGQAVKLVAWSLRLAAFILSTLEPF